jgi:DNA replication protein DnaC
MTPKPNVDLDAVSEQGSILGLTHAAACLPELAEEAVRDDLPPIRFLDRVLEREIERKTERRIATSLKLSGLPTGKTLESFDWTFQPRADRTKLEALGTCAFIRQRENVLFLGPPGVGKRHLAVALGVKAVKNGFSTTHFMLDGPDARAEGRRGDPARATQSQALSQQRAPHRRRGGLPPPRSP